MSQALRTRGALGICSNSSRRRVSAGGLCWLRDTAQSHPPPRSARHSLCFFFRDLFPRVENFCNQRHHGVAVEAGSCRHDAVPERESGRTWVSSAASSPARPGGRPAALRGLRARWPLPRGVWGLVADRLALLGAGHRAWEQRGRGRGAVSQAPCPAGVCPALLWVCSESPWLLVQQPAAPALRSHGG